MNVVISGYYGFGNAGDEAILYAIIEGFKACDEDIKITVLSNDPEQLMASCGVEAVRRWHFPSIYRVLKKSDGLLSGGGSLLQDVTSWRSVPYYLGIMLLSKILGKPFAVFAHGIGPVRHRHNQWLIKKVISKASLITLRDDGSLQFLKDIGINKPMDIIPDPVMSLGSSSSVKGEGKFLAVCVRKWPSQLNYKRKIAATLDLCVEDGFHVTFVPMHGHKDQVISEKISMMMKAKVDIIPSEASVKEKMEFIGQADVLFGMRLHSLIFAAISGIPFVALSYDPKIDAFAQEYNQPVVGTVEDDWNEIDCFQLIARQYADQETHKEKLEAMIRPLKVDIHRSFENVIKVFDHK